MPKFISAVVPKVKHFAWKWFGSMFMELKPSEVAGEVHQALSLTRVLTLATFLGCFGIWLIQGTNPPDTMVYTLWSLVGLKGVDKFATSRKIT